MSRTPGEAAFQGSYPNRDNGPRVGASATMTHESKTGPKETAIDNALPAPRQWSRRMADSALRRYSTAAPRWHYEDGLLLKSFERMWRATGDPRYWAPVRAYGDHFVLPDGSIRMYTIDEYNLDQINPGKILFPLYRETGEERYRSAIELLARAVAPTATDAGRRILAQADLPGPDMAGRHLYGLSFYGGVRPQLRPRRRL